LRFLEKTIAYDKISKILFQKFAPPHRHQSTLLCSNVVKNFQREIGEIVRYLPEKKIGSISNCHYCANRAQNLPEPAPTNGSRFSRFHPNRFTSGGVIAESVKTILFPHRVFAR